MYFFINSWQFHIQDWEVIYYTPRVKRASFFHVLPAAEDTQEFCCTQHQAGISTFYVRGWCHGEREIYREIVCALPSVYPPVISYTVRRLNLVLRGICCHPSSIFCWMVVMWWWWYVSGCDLRRTSTRENKSGLLGNSYSSPSKTVWEGHSLPSARLRLLKSVFTVRIKTNPKTQQYGLNIEGTVVRYDHTNDTTRHHYYTGNQPARSAAHPPARWPFSSVRVPRHRHSSMTVAKTSNTLAWWSRWRALAVVNSYNTKVIKVNSNRLCTSIRRSIKFDFLILQKSKRVRRQNQIVLVRTLLLENVKQPAPSKMPVPS